MYNQLLIKFFSMNSCNQVTLTGYVGGDAETKIVGENTQLTKFSLATTYSVKDKDGSYKKATDWHSIESWNAAAKYAQHLKKGDLVCVDGSIKYTKFTTKDGAQKEKAVIVANGVVCIVKANGGTGTTDASKAEAEKQTAEYVNETTAPGFSGNNQDDDLPF